MAEATLTLALPSIEESVEESSVPSPSSVTSPSSSSSEKDDTSHRTLDRPPVMTIATASSEESAEDSPSSHSDAALETPRAALQSLALAATSDLLETPTASSLETPTSVAETPQDPPTNQEEEPSPVPPPKKPKGILRTPKYKASKPSPKASDLDPDSTITPTSENTIRNINQSRKHRKETDPTKNNTESSSCEADWLGDAINRQQQTQQSSSFAFEDDETDDHHAVLSLLWSLIALPLIVVWYGGVPYLVLATLVWTLIFVARWVRRFVAEEFSMRRNQNDDKGSLNQYARHTRPSMLSPDPKSKTSNNNILSTPPPRSVAEEFSPRPNTKVRFAAGIKFPMRKLLRQPIPRIQKGPPKPTPKKQPLPRRTNLSAGLGLDRTHHHRSTPPPKPLFFGQSSTEDDHLSHHHNQGETWSLDSLMVLRNYMKETDYSRNNHNSTSSNTTEQPTALSVLAGPPPGPPPPPSSVANAFPAETPSTTTANPPPVSPASSGDETDDEFSDCRQLPEELPSPTHTRRRRHRSSSMFFPQELVEEEDRAYESRYGIATETSQPKIQLAHDESETIDGFHEGLFSSIHSRPSTVAGLRSKAGRLRRRKPRDSLCFVPKKSIVPSCPSLPQCPSDELEFLAQTRQAKFERAHVLEAPSTAAEPTTTTEAAASEEVHATNAPVSPSSLPPPAATAEDPFASVWFEEPNDENDDEDEPGAIPSPAAAAVSTEGTLVEGTEPPQSSPSAATLAPPLPSPKEDPLAPILFDDPQVEPPVLLPSPMAHAASDDVPPLSPLAPHESSESSSSHGDDDEELVEAGSEELPEDKDDLLNTSHNSSSSDAYLQLAFSDHQGTGQLVLVEAEEEATDDIDDDHHDDDHHGPSLASGSFDDLDGDEDHGSGEASSLPESLEDENGAIVDRSGSIPDDEDRLSETNTISFPESLEEDAVPKDEIVSETTMSLGSEPNASEIVGGAPGVYDVTLPPAAEGDETAVAESHPVPIVNDLEHLDEEVDSSESHPVLPMDDDVEEDVPLCEKAAADSDSTQVPIENDAEEQPDHRHEAHVDSSLSENSEFVSSSAVDDAPPSSVEDLPCHEEITAMSCSDEEPQEPLPETEMVLSTDDALQFTEEQNLVEDEEPPPMDDGHEALVNDNPTHTDEAVPIKFTCLPDISFDEASDNVECILSPHTLRFPDDEPMFRERDPVIHIPFVTTDLATPKDVNTEPPSPLIVQQSTEDVECVLSPFPLADTDATGFHFESPNGMVNHVPSPPQSPESRQDKENLEDHDDAALRKDHLLSEDAASASVTPANNNNNKMLEEITKHSPSPSTLPRRSVLSPSN